MIKTIIDIYRNSISFIGPRAQAFGIGRGQWYFFNHLLFEGDGLSQEELSARLFVDPAHTARAVKKLEEDGLVERRSDPGDGRKKNVYITPKARALRGEYGAVFQKLNQILAESLSPGEKENLHMQLERLKTNIILFLEEHDDDKTSE